jgi:hypothetical protein
MEPAKDSTFEFQAGYNDLYEAVQKAVDASDDIPPAAIGSRVSEPIAVTIIAQPDAQSVAPVPVAPVSTRARMLGSASCTFKQTRGKNKGKACGRAYCSSHPQPPLRSVFSQLAGPVPAKPDVPVVSGAIEQEPDDIVEFHSMLSDACRSPHTDIKALGMEFLRTAEGDIDSDYATLRRELQTGLDAVPLSAQAVQPAIAGSSSRRSHAMEPVQLVQPVGRVKQQWGFVKGADGKLVIGQLAAGQVWPTVERCGHDEQPVEAEASPNGHGKRARVRSVKR